MLKPCPRPIVHRSNSISSFSFIGNTRKPKKQMSYSSISHVNVNGYSSILAVDSIAARKKIRQRLE
uniref:Uncharacterized protein n=1 Tax=Utricularia reniformis TaxID=192314 RepID=A0A1Y0B0X6_9LAMI|nr:hypothetical protein AEK19_MT0881 [Utricularia reniformis]ART31112.1 hypothetical protein AEK19_MT0881 [Utricularia reniformis]